MNLDSLPARRLRIATLIACLVLAFLSVGHAGLTDFSSGLLQWVEKRFGAVAVQRLQIWHGLLKQMTGGLIPASGNRPPDAAAIQRTLNRVDRFFNQVPYGSDRDLWGVPDYWATPVEMLGIDGGDCEDYAIAKYLSLKDLGIPIERLRISYVRALILGESHMVLAYYATPDADPLILDNLTNDIRPASSRTDLEPSRFQKNLLMKKLREEYLKDNLFVPHTIACKQYHPAMLASNKYTA